MFRRWSGLIGRGVRRLFLTLAVLLAGPGIMADKYYGFDDALYVAVRLVDYLVRAETSAADIRDSLPEMVNTPEIRIEVPEEDKFGIVERVAARVKEAKLDVNDIDGVRVNEGGGWWLLRASNTQNCLVARCEASDEEALSGLKDRVVSELQAAGLESVDLESSAGH